MSPEQFQRALDHLGISQRRFSTLMHVNERTVRNWVKVGVPPPVQVLVHQMVLGRITVAHLEELRRP